MKTLEGDIGSSDITAHTEYVSAIVENRDQVRNGDRQYIERVAKYVNLRVKCEPLRIMST